MGECKHPTGPPKTFSEGIDAVRIGVHAVTWGKESRDTGK